MNRGSAQRNNVKLEYSRIQIRTLGLKYGQYPALPRPERIRYGLPEGMLVYFASLRRPAGLGESAHDLFDRLNGVRFRHGDLLFGRAILN
jgi:hypothetical protein